MLRLRACVCLRVALYYRVNVAGSRGGEFLGTFRLSVFVREKWDVAHFFCYKNEGLRYEGALMMHIDMI